MNDLVARLIEIDIQRRDLKRQDDDLSDERAQLEAALLEIWADANIERIRQNGHTVYVDRRLTASIKPEAKILIAEIFTAAGLSDMLSVNSQTLSAWWRELERQGDKAPPEVVAIITASEIFSIRSRRSD